MSDCALIAEQQRGLLFLLNMTHQMHSLLEDMISENAEHILDFSEIERIPSKKNVARKAASKKTVVKKTKKKSSKR